MDPVMSVKMCAPCEYHNAFSIENKYNQIEYKKCDLNEAPLQHHGALQLSPRAPQSFSRFPWFLQGFMLNLSS